MKYKVLSIPPFDRQLKRLSKRFPSLKKEFTDLLKSLDRNLNTESHLATTALKYVLPLHRKVRENQEAQG